MMDEIHIADGTAVKLLLAGIVLAGGAVGALGVTPAASQAAPAGFADGPSPALVFPIPNVTAGVGSRQLPLDGQGSGPLSVRFPIDNFTVASPIGDASAAGGPWDAKGTDGTGDAGAGPAASATIALALDEAPDELPQDMDPY